MTTLSAKTQRHPSEGWDLGPSGATFEAWRSAALDASLRWHDDTFGLEK